MKYKNSRKKILRDCGFGTAIDLNVVDLSNDRSKLRTALLNMISMLLEPAEWPQEGDIYWFVDNDGVVESDFWCGEDGDYESDRKKFCNLFRTKKEAIKARDKIKSLLKEIK